MVKEIPAGAHCVLMVAGIRKSSNHSHPKSYLLDLCDGAYVMTAFVNEKEKRFTDDLNLINMIGSKHIQVGDKFHFFGLYANNNELFGKDKHPKLTTEHYYLQNSHQYYLKINTNGFIKAHNSDKLGE